MACCGRAGVQHFPISLEELAGTRAFVLEDAVHLHGHTQSVPIDLDVLTGLIRDECKGCGGVSGPSHGSRGRAFGTPGGEVCPERVVSAARLDTSIQLRPVASLQTLLNHRSGLTVRVRYSRLKYFPSHPEAIGRPSHRGSRDGVEGRKAAGDGGGQPKIPDWVFTSLADAATWQKAPYFLPLTDESDETNQAVQEPSGGFRPDPDTDGDLGDYGGGLGVSGRALEAEGLFERLLPVWVTSRTDGVLAGWDPDDLNDLLDGERASTPLWLVPLSSSAVSAAYVRFELPYAVGREVPGDYGKFRLDGDGDDVSGGAF